MSALLDLDATLVWALAALVASAIVLPTWSPSTAPRERRARLEEARALGIDLPRRAVPVHRSAGLHRLRRLRARLSEGDVSEWSACTAVVINGCAAWPRALRRRLSGGRDRDRLGDLKAARTCPCCHRFRDERAGIFVAGELTGDGPDPNAVEQGTQVVATIAARRTARWPRDGSGHPRPGDRRRGASRALRRARAREQGLQALVVDQSRGPRRTILHFPAAQDGAHPPGGLPRRRRAACARSTPRRSCSSCCRARSPGRGSRCASGSGCSHRAPGRAVRGCAPAGDASREVRDPLARRRGTPRKLGVPARSAPKVMYQLPRRRVLPRPAHPGGRRRRQRDRGRGRAGAAGRQPVTLSYRKNAFYRIKKKNQDAIEGLMPTRQDPRRLRVRGRVDRGGDRGSARRRAKRAPRERLRIRADRRDPPVRAVARHRHRFRRRGSPRCRSTRQGACRGGGDAGARPAVGRGRRPADRRARESARRPGHRLR